MFDPIRPIAAVVFVDTLVILYFVILERPLRRSNERSRGERSAFHR